MLSALSGAFPALNSELVGVTLFSAGVLAALYYGIYFAALSRERTLSEKQKSWILTTTSSAIMTILSLPFLFHWIGTGNVISGGKCANYGCCFFIAYLICDLGIGSLHYRSSISFLTGWFHHTAYILLISLLVIPHNFASLFSMCSILELPTFLLAIGSLDKRYRNDYLFATVFFLCRIVLDIYIAVHFALDALYRGGSWIPTIVLSCTLPMHVLWMKDCITSILRRRKRARTAAKSSATPPESSAVVVDDESYGVPAYILSRPAVSNVLVSVRSRNVPYPSVIRRSRQRVAQLLRNFLAEDTQAVVPAGAAASIPAVFAPAARFRSLRRRFVGRT